MKTKLLLFAVVAMTIQLQSGAAVSVDYSTNPAYLQNYGLSAQTADMVQINKARAVGAEYYTPAEQADANHNKFVRFWRNFYQYMDPAADDYSYEHHNTTPAPSYTDL